jgi:outer membrane immunogenic protein
MRKFLLASMAIAAICAAPVRAAADPPVNSIPIFNWTGFYIGAVGTYAQGEARHCAVGTPCPLVSALTDTSGLMAGATAGANAQFGNFVIGAEGDFSYGRIKGSNDAAPAAGPPVIFGCALGCETKINWIGTARGRLGYAFDHLLAYGTAGLAFNGIEAHNGPVSASTTKTSFIWGGGFEFDFSPWSMKVEYLRVEKIGDFVYDRASACASGVTTPCYVTDHSYSMVRFGLNYRFGGSLENPASRQVVDWGGPSSSQPPLQRLGDASGSPAPARQIANWNIPMSPTAVADTGEPETPVPSAEAPKLPVAAKPVAASEPVVISPPAPAVRGNGGLFD